MKGNEDVNDVISQMFVKMSN